MYCFPAVHGSDERTPLLHKSKGYVPSDPSTPPMDPPNNFHFINNSTCQLVHPTCVNDMQTVVLELGCSYTLKTDGSTCTVIVCPGKEECPNCVFTLILLFCMDCIHFYYIIMYVHGM